MDFDLDVNKLADEIAKNPKIYSAANYFLKNVESISDLKNLREKVDDARTLVCTDKYFLFEEDLSYEEEYSYSLFRLKDDKLIEVDSFDFSESLIRLLKENAQDKVYTCDIRNKPFYGLESREWEDPFDSQIESVTYSVPSSFIEHDLKEASIELIVLDHYME